MGTMGSGYEKRGKVDGEGGSKKIDVTDRGEKIEGRGRRERKGASAIGMKGRRGVSVIGLRGKIDARDKSGRREGKGKSERKGVSGRVR